ncbi:FAP103 [Auxenochlorella protothecoides x Auxenochlorella symbiontica]|uniref:nucleoside-diphosphate kinase n=2 Tax=Auxenochlorella protothecoides TaxID=3075 RepID=A0A1D1ZQ03_AUXPR
MATETTYVMIKPDGVQRGLVAPILERFLSKGYTLRGLKFLNVSKEHAERHYADLSSKPFFGGLIEYITSGPVVAIALEGKCVVEQARKIIGATNPLAADPGSIRGQFCIDIGRNIIHGSDTVENAQKELALWFPEGLVDNTPVLYSQIYE